MSKTLPPPPKYQQAGGIIGPSTAHEWNEFYRWLFSMWRMVDGGSIIDIPGAAGQVTGAEADQASVFPFIAPQLPGSPVPDPLPPAFQWVQKYMGAEPIPAPAVAVPYLSRRPIEIIVCTQATFPTLANLIASFVFVSDYVHLIYWNGTTATFAGDQSGCISLWESDPGTGYHLCDGSTVNRLNPDGTLTSVTLPDLTSSGAAAAFLEAGTPNSGPTAAAAPTLTMDSYTPSGSVASTFFGSIINFTTALFVATAGAVAALVSPTSITPSGSVGSLFTGTPATLTGTVSATGEPRKLVRRPYYRL